MASGYTHQAQKRSTKSNTPVVDLSSSDTEQTQKSGRRRDEGDHDSDPDYQENGKPGQRKNSGKKDPKSKSAAQEANLPEGPPANTSKEKDDVAKEKRRRLPWDLPGAQQLILKLRDTVDHEKRKLKHLHGRTDRLKAENGNLTKEIDRLKSRHQESIEANIKLENDYKELHDDRLNILGKNNVAVQPDDVVANELNRIFQNTRTFANQWSVGGWCEVDIVQQGNLMDLLADARKKEVISLRCISAVQKMKIAPKFILHAFINHHICNDTFKRPFGYLKVDGVEPYDTGVELVLKWIMSNAGLGTEAKAYILRAHILRALEPPAAPTAQQQPGSEQGQIMQRLRDEYCLAICTRFFDTYEPLLKRIGEADLEKRKHELLELVTDTLRLSSALAVQYPKVAVFFGHRMLTHRFALGHDWYRPHRAMKLRETEDHADGLGPKEIGVQGKLLDLVIEPLLLRYGDQDGKHYDKKKVLHPAVVWVVPDADLDTTDETPESTVVLPHPDRASTAISHPATPETPPQDEDGHMSCTTPPLNPVRDPKRRKRLSRKEKSSQAQPTAYGQGDARSVLEGTSVESKNTPSAADAAKKREAQFSHNTPLKDTAAWNSVEPNAKSQARSSINKNQTLPEQRYGEQSDTMHYPSSTSSNTQPEQAKNKRKSADGASQEQSLDGDTIIVEVPKKKVKTESEN